MDFSLSPVQKLMCETIRDFMRSKEVQDGTAHAKRTRAFPHKFMEKVASLGFFGMDVEEIYGGAGLTSLDALPIIEEFAYASVSFALNVLVQMTLAQFPIRMFGTEAQKQAYLPRMVQGKLLGCFANTEPDVGSDAKNISLRAQQHGNVWRLDGEKDCCTNASEAGIAIVFARTSPRVRLHPGTTAFLIEIDPLPPGLTITRQKKNAQHGSTLCSISFNDVQIPLDSVLGEVDGGWTICERTFTHSRIWIAMQAVGAARKAFDLTVAYTSQRRTFGKPIIEHQLIGAHLAALKTGIEASRLLALRAGWQESVDDKDPSLLMYAAMAKYQASEIAEQTASRLYRYSGRNSIMEEWAAAEHLLDILPISIYEGASEIQLHIIANLIKNSYHG